MSVTSSRGSRCLALKIPWSGAWSMYEQCAKHSLTRLIYSSLIYTNFNFINFKYGMNYPLGTAFLNSLARVSLSLCNKKKSLREKKISNVVLRAHRRVLTGLVSCSPPSLSLRPHVKGNWARKGSRRRAQRWCLAPLTLTQPQHTLNSPGLEQKERSTRH